MTTPSPRPRALGRLVPLFGLVVALALVVALLIAILAVR